jgi:hypothetical protein
VYSPDEPIECTLVLHQDGEPLDVRKIKAKVIQTIIATKETKTICMLDALLRTILSIGLSPSFSLEQSALFMLGRRSRVLHIPWVVSLT